MNTQSTLKIQMVAFHAKALSNGKKLTTWVCPHCNKPIDTIQPQPNEVTSKGYWDSLKRCYECDKPSFVAVYPGGLTEVTPLNIG